MSLLVALVVATPGCSNDTPTPDVAAEDVPDVPAEPETRQLVDNYEWKLVPNAEDPFYAGNEQKAQECSTLDITTEEYPEGPWFEVDTKGCAYMTAKSPLTGPIPEGATIQLRIWRFTISVAEGPFELKLAIGDDAEVIFERTIDAPNKASELIHDTWTSEKAWPEGTPVYWHLSNHGENTWGMIEFSATY